jgi:hypothetical protein
MARAIQVTPEFQRYDGPGVDGFRIRATVTAAVDMPRAVFAYRLEPIQPAAEGEDPAEPRAIFSHVCSPADLEEFPADAPYPNANPPWFRRDTIDLVWRARVQATEDYEAILRDITNLRDSLDRMDELTTLAPVWLGTPPEEG